MLYLLLENVADWLYFFSDTDEELKEWKTKFDERIAMLESKSSKLEREKDDLAARSSLLNIAIKESIKEISKLQTEAEVMFRNLCIFW